MEKDLEDSLIMLGIKEVTIFLAQMVLFFLLMINLFIIIKIVVMKFIAAQIMVQFLEEGLIFVYVIIAIQVIRVIIIQIILIIPTERNVQWQEHIIS